MTQTLGWQLPPFDEATQIVRKYARPFTGDRAELGTILDLVGDARIVLIGEASHGTHEFYKTRADITRRLIEEKGFMAVAAEADWPDAWRVNRYVRGIGADSDANGALGSFERFPSWMWRNADVLSFVEWLYAYNLTKPGGYEMKVGFYGLDLYSLYSSAHRVIDYLEKVDQAAADRARQRYACLEAFGADEQAYGYATSLGLTKSCEDEVTQQLMELRQQEASLMERDGRAAADEYFFVQQNARLVRNAEEYYRNMFSGRVNTWNLRDTHMAETLYALDRYFAAEGQQLKVVVWAHNSHLGDARATQMGASGEINLGQLAREHYGTREARLIGFSGYTGTVTAASNWGGIAERKNVRRGIAGSYEQLFHGIDLPSFILCLQPDELRKTLYQPRLQRAIGVIYVPETERMSHYFYSRLPDQFDGIIHFEETQAVEPLERTSEWVSGEMPTGDTGVL